MATAFWDGKYVGVTPVKLTNIPAGRHGLKLTRHGYRNSVQLVTIQNGEVKLDVKLVPRATGALRLVSQPSEASVVVQGEPRGRTPITLNDLPVGQVRVRLEKEEYLPAQVDANISPNKTTELSVTLQSKAEAFLLEKIEREPHRVRHHTELGHLYMMRRDYDRAFATYARGMDACVGPKAIPDDCLRHYNELQYCYDGDIVKFADPANLEAFRARFVKLYEEGMKRVPSNERNYRRLAAIKEKKADWPAAISLHEQTIKHARNSRIKHRAERAAAKAHYQHGAVLSRKKQYAQAAQEYEKTIARYPKAAYSRSALSSAVSLYNGVLKKPARVVELRRIYLKHFPRSSSAPTYLRAVADALLAQSKHKEALAEYQRLLKQYPESDSCPSVMIAVAKCYAAHLGDEGKAIQTYTDCAKRYPNHRSSASALAAAAALYEKRGDAVHADALNALILKRYPRSSEAGQVDDDPKSKATRQQIADLYTQAKSKEAQNPAEAIALHEKIVTSHPHDYYAPYSLSRIISRHQKAKNYGAEMAARERHVKLFSDDQTPSQLIAMGSRYTQLGQYDKAITAYRRVPEQYPDSDQCPSAIYHIGLIYHQKTHEQIKAISEFRQLAKKWPDHTYAAGAVYYVGWVQFLCLKGKSQQAVTSFRELLTRYPYETHADSIEYWLDALQKTKPEPKGWWK